MTIETKYNIGDEVWMMKCNKPIRVKILEIRTLTQNVCKVCIKKVPETTIIYSLEGMDFMISEDKLFPTKEELLKSL